MEKKIEKKKTTKPVEELLKEKKIYEIVNPKLVQAPHTITIQAAVDLMQQNKSGYVVLAKAKKVFGLFTETDMINKVLEKESDWSKPASEFMTKDWCTLKMTDSAGQAIDMMSEKKFYHIPLVDENDNLVNVISVRTLTRFLAEFYPTEIYNLPPRFNQVMETQEGG